MVRDIIIASSSDKVRAQLRGFVAEMGIMGVIECRSASQTLDFAQRLPSAIIICHRLTDMAPAAMLRLLPPGADMILLISSAQSPLFGMSNVQCFFQAEDGIRDSSVTGVQTCALPICM